MSIDWWRYYALDPKKGFERKPVPLPEKGKRGGHPMNLARRILDGALIVVEETLDRDKLSQHVARVRTAAKALGATEPIHRYNYGNDVVLYIGPEVKKGSSELPGIQLDFVGFLPGEK